MTVAQRIAATLRRSADLLDPQEQVAVITFDVERYMDDIGRAVAQRIAEIASAN